MEPIFGAPVHPLRPGSLGRCWGNVERLGLRPILCRTVVGGKLVFLAKLFNSPTGTAKTEIMGRSLSFMRYPSDPIRSSARKRFMGLGSG